MKIKSLEIKNYRRFIDTKLILDEENITILAGANNSGKTSLVRLLKTVFQEQNNLMFSDTSIKMKTNLYRNLKDILKSEFITSNTADQNDFSKFKYRLELFFNECLNKYLIQVNLTIGYGLNEDISLFSDYLMDLDEDKQEFYFTFRQEYNSRKFTSLKDINLKELYKFYKEGREGDFLFQKVLNFIIEEVLEINYYYTDESFKLKNKMKFTEFTKLFNFHLISANRELDDDEIKNRKITNEIIDITNPLNENTQWEDLYKDTFSNIETTLNNSTIRKNLQDLTSQSLQKVFDDIKNVSETEIDKLETTMDFEPLSFIKLIKESINSKYVYLDSGQSNLLGEETQGLGISNLIYLTLAVSKYRQTLVENKVNLFIIEEPEVHLHVQMERILIDFLTDIFNGDNKETGIIQGFITTHSSEIVSNVKPSSIKVIRPIKFLENKIFDMNVFLNENEEINDFINIFFKLNFANLIFSDKAILYEGDTEKLFIEAIISRKSSNENYKNLSKQFISYCQVGGAHAKKYFRLLDFLQVKTCVFTDIDYGTNKTKNTELIKEKTTNSTLIEVVRKYKENEKMEVKIEHILEWQENTKDKSIEYNTKIFTQTGQDGYARTLEDSILYIMLAGNTDYAITDVFTNIEKENWRKFIKDNKLLLSVPKPKTGANVRYQAKHIDKTDFMYSLISNENIKDFIPDYIQRGLVWLNQD